MMALVKGETLTGENPEAGMSREEISGSFFVSKIEKRKAQDEMRQFAGYPLLYD